MNSTHSRYLIRVALLVALLMILVAVVDIIVDPYFVFGRANISGLNARRVDAVDYPEISKFYSIVNLGPPTLIFGSSLAEIGLAPEHAGFLAKPVYNVGLPGVGTFVMRRYFQHALAIGHPQQVIMGVELLQFHTTGPPDDVSKARFDRLAVDADGRPTSKFRLWWARLVDFRFAALSANAVSSSWKTIAENQGFSVGMRWITLANGQSVLIHRSPYSMFSEFRNTERGFLRNILSPLCLTDRESDYSALDEFRQIVRMAYQHDVDLRIFISPSHAGLTETIAQAGLWEKWERWKRQITTIVFEEAGDNLPFPLWDFSGYNEFSTAPVPPPNSLEPMQWNVDSLHYTKELGDVVLDVILGRSNPNHPILPGFGIRVTPATIESQLADIRADREKWRLKFPEHAAQVKQFADEIPYIRIKNASCD
jgi:hypothetical protein